MKVQLLIPIYGNRTEDTWLGSWVTDWMVVDWCNRCGLDSWLIGWLIRWLVYWVGCWLVGWLIGSLSVGWMADG